MIGRLFQYSTLGALASGIVQGSMTIKDLLNEGNQGIGTLHAANGELVVLDGIPYLIHASGKVSQVDEEEKVPYAAVSQFYKPWRLYHLGESINFDQFEKQVEGQLMSPNIFHFIRLEGTFSYMKCRSLVKQEKPYVNLEEASQSQSEFVGHEIKGTILGFFTPHIYPTISAPGLHLHFLNDDLNFGGHILEFISSEDVTVKIQPLDRVSIESPTEDPAFLEAHLDHDEIVRGIEEAE